MSARIPDKTRKLILADSVNGMSNLANAKKHHVSDKTVARIIKEDTELSKKVEQKKEQNTQAMLEYMGAQAPAAQKVLDNILQAINDPVKLAKANVRDLATAYGIIADKFIQTAPKANDELLQRASEILGDINGVIR